MSDSYTGETALSTASAEREEVAAALAKASNQRLCESAVRSRERLVEYFNSDGPLVLIVHELRMLTERSDELLRRVEAGTIGNDDLRILHRRAPAVDWRADEKVRGVRAMIEALTPPASSTCHCTTRELDALCDAVAQCRAPAVAPGEPDVWQLDQVASLLTERVNGYWIPAETPRSVGELRGDQVEKKPR